SSKNLDGDPGQLHPLDTHHGLEGMGRDLSQGFTGSGQALSQRGIFREACDFPTTMRAQARPTGQETMMRFYNQPHRFYYRADMEVNQKTASAIRRAGPVMAPVLLTGAITGPARLSWANPSICVRRRAWTRVP